MFQKITLASHRINIIPRAAKAKRPRQLAAKHPPAKAPCAASSPLPLCMKPMIAPITIAIIIIQNHIA